MTVTATAEGLKPQEYAAMHKRAFREAFDFLNAHFPPQFDSEWWVRTYKDITEILKKDPENPLLKQLLEGIIIYMDDESKKKRDGVGEANADAS